MIMGDENQPLLANTQNASTTTTFSNKVGKEQTQTKVKTMNTSFDDGAKDEITAILDDLQDFRRRQEARKPLKKLLHLVEVENDHFMRNRLVAFECGALETLNNVMKWDESQELQVGEKRHSQVICGLCLQILARIYNRTAHHPQHRKDNNQQQHDSSSLLRALDCCRKAMERHMDSVFVQSNAFDLLRIWVKWSSYQVVCQAFVQQGGLVTLCKTMKVYTMEHSIQSKACGLLKKFAQRFPKQVVDSGALEAVIESMNAHLTNAGDDGTIHLAGCEMITILVSSNNNTKKGRQSYYSAKVLGAGGLQALRDAQVNHKDDDFAVAIALKQAIAAMLD